MKKHHFLMISGDGNRVSRWDELFPKAEFVCFGEVVNSKADFVWLKLNPFEPADTQIAWYKKHYQQPFVVMSNIPNLPEALQALNAGARAYLNTHAGPNNLKQIVRVVDDHGIWVGEDLMQVLVQQLANQTKKSKKQMIDSDWKAKLSSREVEVANCVVKAMPNKLIARELGITERTVKSHLTAIFEKLEVQDRLKLVILVTK